MTERDKLIELLIGKSIDTPIDVEYVVDYLLENGVILPPVKVGDPVFRIGTWNGKYVVEGKISMLKQKADFTWKFRGIGKGFEGSKDYTIADIGLTVFLTREDAEKALNEQKK